MGVVGFTLSQCPFTGFSDAGGSIEIRLSNFQMDHVLTLFFKLLGALEHIHNYKRPYIFGAFADHREMPKIG